MAADNWWPPFLLVKQNLHGLVAPLQHLANYPGQAGRFLGQNFVTLEALKDDNQSLRQQNLNLQRKVQRFAAVAAQNNRLRELLGASAELEAGVLVAELLALDPDPYTHQIVINRGTNQGVAVGQSVLDAYGLMGQVIAVSNNTSRVLLITDASHSIPVQVSRNDFRALASGLGDRDYLLRLDHVAKTADLKVGDLLISSGLGGRFPSGYPVASIIKISQDPSQAFLTISAKPSARLNRSRYLLVVQKQGLQP